ncbi:MAG TPA: DUF4129 domain-containing protein [Woeseiaceae bacterium]|nr:DUF4129 domain-containing protein [Woeseiaceae bacterium]
MRRHCKVRRSGLLCALAAIPLLVAPAAATAEQPEPIREAAIVAAIERVSADPALSTERTVHRLKWIDAGEEQVTEAPGWTRWVIELFGWLAEASRLLVWLLIAALLALLVLYAVRLTRAFGRDGVGAGAPVPTHVRDLDIRPESLPGDIGAAAWELWERGARREAVALMYRGLLSRLVHVHEVPIRDSSTEGESLALAERHLPSPRRGYVARLIRTWQLAMYGGEDPQGAEMRALCEQFAAALERGEAAAEAAT